MEKTKEQRREELRGLTSRQIADILAKQNPFGGYSATAIERHRDSYIESVLAWEGFGK
jgi:hypothetical protein